jgi:hypothetical protein
MEVIGTSKTLIENSSEEKLSFETVSYPVLAPPNTPITATPPTTPCKAYNDSMVEISTVSVTESFGSNEDASPENRRRSGPIGNMIFETMSPDLPKMLEKSLKIKYNPMNYAGKVEYRVGNEVEFQVEFQGENQNENQGKSYAQSSPTLPRAKMISPDVSPITSEFNSIDDEDEGRFSDFMKVFGGDQGLNRFVSDDELLQMQDEESEVSYAFEDSKSFLNNVREISYDDESLLQ